jgi:predicted nucleic-acid-binding Zn-ribbon protein
MIDATPNRFNMSCPKCGSTEQVDISVFLTIRLTPAGFDSTDIEPDWTNDNGASCAACGYVGTVKEFAPLTGLTHTH